MSPATPDFFDGGARPGHGLGDTIQFIPFAAPLRRSLRTPTVGRLLGTRLTDDIDMIRTSETNDELVAGIAQQAACTYPEALDLGSDLNYDFAIIKHWRKHVAINFGDQTEQS